MSISTPSLAIALLGVVAVGCGRSQASAVSVSASDAGDPVDATTRAASRASAGPERKSHDGGADAGKKKRKHRKKPLGLVLSADPSTCEGGASAPDADATYLSDPVATFEATSYGYVLHQELDAYGNYGADDDAVDILYSGDVGSWTFSVPPDAIVSATVVVSMVADDGSYDPSQYSFNLWTSECPFGSTGGLPHGTPFNSQFSDWQSLSYAATPTAGAPLVVTIQNTSGIPHTDWIAIDWIELQVTTVNPVTGACDAGTVAPPASATYVSAPGQTLTVTSDGYVLHQELDAFPNYGATDDAADILYSGDVGAWTFSVPPGAIDSATVVASMVADDSSAARSDYSFSMWTGWCPDASAGTLPHGAPADAPFDDWRSVSYPAGPVPGSPFVVSIQNTSSLPTGRWLGVDWIELRVTTGTGGPDGGDGGAFDSGCGDTQTDPANCGSCGHGCLQGLCVGGACQPFTLATAQGSPNFLTAQSGTLAWTDNLDDRVMTCAVSGCAPTALATGQNVSAGIASNASAFYWVDEVASGTVSGCAAGGCSRNPTVLSSGEDHPYGIAVDATNVYWTDYAGGNVSMCPLAGCAGAPTVLASGQSGPWGIAVDSARVYWTSNVGGSVLACAIGGCGGSPTVLATLQSAPCGVAVDATTVYWANSGSGSIMTCPVGGCGGVPVVLVAGQSAPAQIAVDGTNAYYTDYGAGTVSRCALGGCSNAPTVMARGQSGPFALALDSGAVYFGTYGGGTIVGVAK